MTNRGQFIVIEGADGAGKTTQVRLLETALAKAGVPVERTREPSDGGIGREIRKMLNTASDAPPLSWETVALMFAADRAVHVEDVVKPMLARGAVVICDRYDMSNLIYQGRDMGRLNLHEAAPRLKWVHALNKHAIRPDLTIVITVTTDNLIDHLGERAHADKFDNADFARDIAWAYSESKRLLPHDNIKFARGDGTIEEVHEQIMGIVGEHMKKVSK